MKPLAVYIVLMTWLFAWMDWEPIHYAWWHYGQYPTYAQNWQTWANVRLWSARVLCPPCGALAENYYYVLMEVESGDAEQASVLQVPYNHNPINPHGNWSFYWGQGEGQPWRQVSMLSFYLYWLPYSVLWWYGWKAVFTLWRKWRTK